MDIPQEVLAYGWIPFTVVVVVSYVSYVPASMTYSRAFSAGL